MNEFKFEVLVDPDLAKAILKSQLRHIISKVEGEENTYRFNEIYTRKELVVKESIVKYGIPLFDILPTLTDCETDIVYETNGMIIVPKERTVINGDRRIVLRRQSMRMLELLLTDYQVIHSREKLCMDMSEGSKSMDDNALNACVCRLRDDLAKVAVGEMIETYNSMGYRWKHEVVRNID